MHKRDWWWLLGLPIYQTIGTIRHEAGHALMALAMGGKVTEFVIFPGLTANGQLYFGYMRYDGPSHWLIIAGPYILDILTFVIFFAITMRLPFKHHWLWLNLVIFGVISPLVNSSYQYLKPLIGMQGDVPILFTKLPNNLIHAYFILTLGLYAAGVVMVFKQSQHIQSRGAKHV